ncbi:uncharacterized protein LOC107434048 [Ziziphus jujuba]|uniref:Uncharacterized protein LOC107434048 n=1 Tax=Ziziphus jujuba TaxID=326968 RepID=A0ABM3I047_ZIZJJ|nr:uncharacterized protein LOC107434048 [Ziziphus jujuba]
MRLNRLEWISIEDIEKVVNSRAYVCFSRAEITILLEMLQSDNIVSVNNEKDAYDYLYECPSPMAKSGRCILSCINFLLSSRHGLDAFVAKLNSLSKTVAYYIFASFSVYFCHFSLTQICMRCGYQSTHKLSNCF